MNRDNRSKGRRTLSEADYRALARFRHVLARFLAFSEDAARKQGLQPRQHQALLAVRGGADGRPITIGQLAERLLIRHHSAVGLVDRLAAAGLLVRASNASDRRKVAVSITAEGRRTLEALSAVHRAELRRLAPVLRDLLEEIEQGTGADGGSGSPNPAKRRLKG